MKQLSALQLLTLKVSKLALVAMAEGLEEFGDKQSAVEVWVTPAEDHDLSHQIRSSAINGIWRCLDGNPTLRRTRLEYFVEKAENNQYLRSQTLELIQSTSRHGS